MKHPILNMGIGTLLLLGGLQCPPSKGTAENVGAIIDGTTPPSLALAEVIEENHRDILTEYEHVIKNTQLNN